jgi:hypothetical protein
MRSWPALLVAPLIALTDLSVLYAMVTPSCARQDRVALHAVAATSLVVVIGLTLLAWRAWRRESRASGGAAAFTAADSSAVAQRPSFIDTVALAVGALSLLVCLALWLPVWLISPCY